jgi:hypothetical protein
LRRQRLLTKRHVTPNLLELVVRETRQLLFVEIPFKDEATKDHRELRIAIVEQLLELPPPLPQVIANRPHVVDVRCGGSLCLELGEDGGQHRLTRRLVGTACDLLLGVGPVVITHGVAP